MQTDIFFAVIVLAYSAILHEVAHGYMANYLGDPTARLAGRLTLNPLKHIDPVGTILLPAILILSGSPIFIAYAKPVPYNPYNLHGKFDEALVAFAGPGTNIVLAILFAVAVRVFTPTGATPLGVALGTIVYINMLLALFNLIPLPPLDGSKVLASLLPGSLGRGYENFLRKFTKLGMLPAIIILLFFFYFLSPYFYTGLTWLFSILTGLR